MNLPDSAAADTQEFGDTLSQDRVFRVLYAEGDLNFRSLAINDPVPLGRQILETAGVRSLHAYSLFAITKTGDFEDVSLEEPFDLRAKGAERFVAFNTDRIFKFFIDERQIAWGQPGVSEAILRGLADSGPGKAVFLEVRGGTDRLIHEGETVDLAQPGVEVFITADRPDPNRLEVFVVYNGLRKPFEATKTELVQTLLHKAMAAFGASGDLVLTNEAGAVLDPNATLENTGVHQHATLLLRPRTVSGGVSCG